MNSVQAKGARWALAIVLALVCAVVVAIPTLATAGDEPETAKVGVVDDKPATDADKQGNEAAKKATGADKQGMKAMGDPENGGQEDQSNPGGQGGQGGNEGGTSGDQSGQVGPGGPDNQGGNGGGNQPSDDLSNVNINLQDANLSFENGSYLPASGLSSAISKLVCSCSLTPIEEGQGPQNLKGYLWQGTDYEIDCFLKGGQNIGTELPTQPGSYTLKVKPVQGSSTRTGIGTVEFTITEQQEQHGENGGPGANSLHVELLQNELVYTGQPVSLQISSVNYQGKTLSADEYTISGYKKGNDDLTGAPIEPGEYRVVVSGLGTYAGVTGNPQFTIVEANSLESKNRVSVTTDRKYYTLTGASLQPKVTVTFDGKELVEGTDYTVKYQCISGSQQNTEVDKVTESGQYQAVAHAVEGGLYTGTATSTKPFEVVGDAKDLQYATLALAGEKSYGNQTINPTVTWADGSATPPAMTVTSAAGDVLKEGTDFKFQYAKSQGPGQPDWADTISAGEGTYSARAVAIDGSGYKGESRETLRFFVAAADHDMTKATVTLPDAFTWKNDAEITDELKAKLAVKLGNAVLTVDKDFDISHMSPNNWRPGTGVVGKHTLVIMGNMSSSARHQGNEGPQVSGEKYYGVTTVTYGVWNDEAPAADQRVDTATGVKVAGSTIANNSTIKTEEWVSFGASKLSDADVAAVPAVKAAKDAAASSGAVEVLAYDAKLEHRSANGSTEGMTEDLDITLSFPVDAKYNGKKATITQIHDGVAMDPVTVTVANGQATVPTDRLSEFVISVSDEKAADEKATDEKAATKGDKAADSKTTGKTTSAKTGDVVLPMVIGALVVIAIVAVVALLVSRRRSNS